jgi:hypothetical protein
MVIRLLVLSRFVERTRVYFEIGGTEGKDGYTAIYVAGGEPLPDSNEDNTTYLYFEYAYGHLPSPRLPWRMGSSWTEVAWPSKGAVGDVTTLTVDEDITHIGNSGLQV